MNYKGIIIYKTAYQSKTIILNDSDTMHVIYINTNKIVPVGSLIRYSKKYKGENCFGEYINIENLPLTVAKEDIYFLHHIFEIIYAFMPTEKTIPGIFEHILFLYSRSFDYWIQNIVWKKLFIGRLLFLLSIYQEEEKNIIAFLHKINHLPIDRVSIESLDLAEEEALDNWLRTIFTVHQRLNKFKKIYFTSQCGKI
ncbi:MAG TPA: hypothetical protein VL201_03165 [Patescibacteria group bacterium]|jgi:hypothetical protein|nr:hypothetical protein [Patescibacteria group bacterium]